MKPAVGRPSGPEPSGTEVLLGLLFVLLLCAGYFVVKAYTYGDWRCAFAQCRIEAH